MYLPVLFEGQEVGTGLRRLCHLRHLVDVKQQEGWRRDSLPQCFLSNCCAFTGRRAVALIFFVYAFMVHMTHTSGPKIHGRLQLDF